MIPRQSKWSSVVAVVLLVGASAIAAYAQDQLPSWNDGPTKQAIVAFVEKVTTEGGPDFVPPADRIATFDNDGTLWVEQPLYTQLTFALDRVKALAPQHPEWRDQEPFKSILAGDVETALSGGEKAIGELLAATHAGMTTDQFAQIVEDWIATAKHPRFERVYTECVYQPQLELLAYLRANGFKTFIVSGGGIEFMRPWSDRVYGIDPPQVVGSSIITEFQIKDGKPVLVRLPKINFIDDKAGKPVGINQHIGQRPILAFGNSDGDREMLEYATGGDEPRLGLLVLHSDAEREYAYGPASGLPDSKIGTFSQSLLDEANERGWVVVDMKRDWAAIFSADAPGAGSPAAAPGEGNTMTGQWQLVSIGEAAVPANVDRPALTVVADGSISGSTSVNRFMGGAGGPGGSLFGPIAITRRAGPPAAMRIESQYTAALSRANRFERDGDTLRLFANGQLLLVFEAVRP